jgi:hypothetical protein
MPMPDIDGKAVSGASEGLSGRQGAMILAFTIVAIALMPLALMAWADECFRRRHKIPKSRFYE